MGIFCTDLDNTIIYSYKHDIGPDKRNVEIYNEREISYISETTYGLLKKVSLEMMIIPVSTRTVEQYNRIDLGIGGFKYALVCNGAILLRDGRRDLAWYEESLNMIGNARAELMKALNILEADKRRSFELRFIEDLFVFTKCSNPNDVVCGLKKVLDTGVVDVFNNGEKVYVLPNSLSKGNAVKRLRKLLNPDYIIAAGDSEFDISMAKEADYGFLLQHFMENQCDKSRLFSEAVLEEVLKIMTQKSMEIHAYI